MFEVPADAWFADLTRLVACCVGYVSSRVSPVVDVRGVRAAGHRAGRAGRAPHRGGHARRRRLAAAVSFHTACRFFSRHSWDADRIGLALARLVVDRLLGEHAPIMVVDDTLIRRWGPKVFGAFWTHDGSAQDPNALGRGNRWVVAGIVLTVPFCAHPGCLPVLLGLWRGQGTASPVRLAGELISVLAQAFADRRIHVVGDAAYHGKPLLIAGATIATGCRPTRSYTRSRRRAPASAAAPASKATGSAARPRSPPPRAGAQRRAAQPWYRHKHEPAFEDMLTKLRRTLRAARITGVAAAQPDPNKYRDYELACAAAAA
jgi:hypothetical protein